MRQYLKRYSDQNPEKFNKDFILSREDQDILEYARNIFKSLEVLDEIKVEDVTINHDEASFGPIKAQHQYFKAVLPSRLDKIHYRVRITPNEEAEVTQIDLSNKKSTNKLLEKESFIKEGDIYINKLIDNCFYVNEGVRYFLIYQIVDNATYGIEDAVCLKSLSMPITIQKRTVLSTPEYCKTPMDLNYFDCVLFSKVINPAFYVLAKESFNSIVALNAKNNVDIFDNWSKLRDTKIIDAINSYYGSSLVFADKLLDIDADKYTIFRVVGDKAKNSDNGGCFIGVPTNEIDKAENKLALGAMLNIRDNKKKRIVYTYDELTSPWFWIDNISQFFTKNTDFMKKFTKVRAMLISLSRLMDETTQSVLKLDDRDKSDTLAIIRYMMERYDELHDMNSRDLKNKRLRLFEYQLYPLQVYFSSQIYRILNAPTRSRAVLDRAFNSLSPLFVIKQTVVSELLRYYNSTNEINLYSAFLKYTFRGPQSLSKAVTNAQRDLDPSFTGRLSLIASSAGDPGMSGSICPFVEVDDYYFDK